MHNMERDLTRRLKDSHICRWFTAGEQKASSEVQQWLDGQQTLGYCEAK